MASDVMRVRLHLPQIRVLEVVEDRYSRRMLGYATSLRHPDAELATAALNMGRRHPRRRRRRLDLLHRQGLPVHLARPRERVPPPRGHPVHGPRRQRPGQRLRRVVLLHPPARVHLPAELAHPRPSPPRDRQLDLRLVQPPTPTLRQQHDQPQRPRESPSRLNQHSKIWGEAHDLNRDSISLVCCFCCHCRPDA